MNVDLKLGGIRFYFNVAHRIVRDSEVCMETAASAKTFICFTSGRVQFCILVSKVYNKKYSTSVVNKTNKQTKKVCDGAINSIKRETLPHCGHTNTKENTVN